MKELHARVAGEVRKVVVGQAEALEDMLAALALGGHVLLEGVPGTAKTLLASATARALGIEFRRLQFTPDMLPSDVTGTMALRAGELVFRPGPVFAGVVLADEINRTPPKTQAALLEAMQEGQVTIDGVSHALPDPFLVLATQNPVEYEGTYPLPEAQRDRFLVHVAIGYPSADEERAMLRLRPPRARAGRAGRRRRGRQRGGPARRAGGGRRDRDHRGGRRLRRRDRPPHARAAERHARREPARRGAPAGRRQGRGAAGRPRLRHARRRLAHGRPGPAPPARPHARGRARARDPRRARSAPRSRTSRSRDERHPRTGCPARLSLGESPAGHPPAVAPMTPAPRAVIALAVIALAALLVPLGLVALAALALVVAVVVDARAAKRQPQVDRQAPRCCRAESLHS